MRAGMGGNIALLRLLHAKAWHLRGDPLKEAPPWVKIARATCKGEVSFGPARTVPLGTLVRVRRSGPVVQPSASRAGFLIPGYSIQRIAQRGSVDIISGSSTSLGVGDLWTVVLLFRPE